MLRSLQQVLLFSATFPDEVMAYARKFSPNANEIKLKHEEQTVAGISQMFMDCPSEEGKYDILVKLYGLMTIGSSIIFVKVAYITPPVQGISNKAETRDGEPHRAGNDGRRAPSSSAARRL